MTIPSPGETLILRVWLPSKRVYTEINGNLTFVEYLINLN